MRNQSLTSSILPTLLLSLLISSLSSSLSSTPKSSLDRGSSLSVEDESDILISSDNSFTCGFYKVGTNAYCFSIWFSNAAEKTVVWMANRDRPVNGQGSRISLNRGGNMVLTDVDGSTVWNTNTSSTAVAKAELLNSGNLVLKDPNGNILWQSFDYPTDTLLPSQPITKVKRIISTRGRGIFSSGFFSLFFDNDNVLRLMYDGPEISSVYWPNPDNGVFGNDRTNYNSSRYAVLDAMGRFTSSDKLKFNASDMGLGIRRRLTLDYDGNLRLYSLNGSIGSWGISWVALSQQCNVHGLCGRNGICIYTPAPTCSCPPGYEMKDPSDWNQGCRPKFNRICDPQHVLFVKLPQIDFYGYDFDYKENISIEACRQICLNDCSCDAFGYRLTGTGVCYPKSALFNGYRSPAFPGSMYLKLPKNLTLESSETKESELVCEYSRAEVKLGSSDMYNRSRDMKYVYFYWFVSAIGAIEIFFIASGWWYLFRKHGTPTSVEDGYQMIYNQFRRFTYRELKKATKKFKEELGRGASGSVYKGVLDDERVVAVKKLGDVIQGGEEFWAEMNTIGRIYHMNLVRMWGYCSEGVHRLLVYEFVENGSLDKHLFSNDNSIGPASALGWKERFKIAVGTAKGLAYLHHECLEWVIHCDVKPENILLDSVFEPKIADFGLAKLSERGGSSSNFSRIRGTMGYMAPEWALNLPITAKVDVYSYGVVLLEIVKGIRLSNWVVDGEEEEVELKRFVRVAKEKIERGKESWVGDLVDSRLNGQFDWKQAATMVELGISCVEEERNRRPTMDIIVQTLLNYEEEPKSPFLQSLQYSRQKTGPLVANLTTRLH
ncbi:putative receptor protein kinase ZmPK1 [Magnolia sinica]|uniref:putative receptor protein kinase ZmPK1 n=1 Tax=Magnolia sinica TaxID=86752 RepID=UPI002658A775|nr:putative receptor protein kinase ZmPK1 [Magnolia sinica]